MADDKGKKADKKEEAAEKTEATEAAPAPKSKKTMFIAIGAVVLVLLIGAPVMFFVLSGKDKKATELTVDPEATPEEETQAEGALDEDELDENEEALGAMFPLDTLVVNLDGGRFIRCQIQIEFNDRDVPSRFYLRMVPIRDSIIRLLASKKAEDVQGEKGFDNLKSNIKDIVNEVLKREEAKNIYFTQFVVQ